MRGFLELTAADAMAELLIIFKRLVRHCSTSAMAFHADFVAALPTVTTTNTRPSQHTPVFATWLLTHARQSPSGPSSCTKRCSSCSSPAASRAASRASRTCSKEHQNTNIRCCARTRRSMRVYTAANIEQRAGEIAACHCCVFDLQAVNEADKHRKELACQVLLTSACTHHVLYDTAAHVPCQTCSSARPAQTGICASSCWGRQAASTRLAPWQAPTAAQPHAAHQLQRAAQPSPWPPGSR